MPHQVVLATGNAGKVAEMQDILQEHDVEVKAQSEFGLSSVEETGLTFVENALLKARHATRHTGLPAIADDSGVVVQALGGAPGIYSARYAGEKADAAANNRKLLEAIREVPSTDRQAHFFSLIVYLRHPEDPEPLICEGRWSGEILLTPRGEHGFGYDPIFFLPKYGCSAAELDPELKQTISHRGQALTALCLQLHHARH